MQLDGFEIRSGYVLLFCGQDFDLHNDFDVVDVTHEPSTTSASVKLQPSREAQGNKSLPQEIMLRFEQVSRFLRTSGDPELAADKKIIRFIGFLHSDDDTMDGFLEELTDPSQDLIVNMEDDSAFRVQATKVTIAVDA